GPANFWCRLCSRCPSEHRMVHGRPPLHVAGITIRRLACRAKSPPNDDRHSGAHGHSVYLRNVSDLDLDNIRDKTATLLVTRRDDAREPVAPQQLPIYRICYNDLISAKIRRDLTGTKYRFISIAAGHDHDLVQDIVLNTGIQYDANGLQEIPKQGASK